MPDATATKRAMRTLVGIALLLLAPLAPAAAPASTPTAEIAVLFVGNSLSYVNQMPALLAAMGSAQADGRAWRADLVGAPGGTLADRWRDGVAAREIDSGRWNVLVLQERGGQLACLAQPERRTEPDCTASLAAHKRFAERAHARGLRVLVLGTWGPDPYWQRQLSRGLRVVADASGAEAVDAGPLVRDYAREHPQTPMTVDAIGHPTVEASLLVAARLYRALTERPAAPAPFAVAVPLLPRRAAVAADRPLSQQADLAGDGRVTRFDAAQLQPLCAAAAQ